MRYLFVFFLLLPLPALADTPLTAQEFDARTVGKILFFGAEGQRYGVEEYLPDRRVRWSFLDGKCRDGVWYENGPEICFLYEDNPEPQCWLFYTDGDGMRAEFATGNDPTILYEVESGDEMLCLGPDVGV
ncbi:hypothetical protein Q8W37_12900 [Shimia thalassica]|uniref:hypothetical protein n=1 Tax=Shimia thalassica TaxID=1715693 RepID=UPI000C087E86|nr:hypothetical protein [Shimia thalassica]PHO03464.1 hypothetical protein CSC82_12955 [Rhodobacteraceae bacterium 4F10]MBU2943124.1 hypothetical protein [Shimia thalassica]MDO6482053.1 hypothetical protein [Shimia thalassica]MDO6502553.1 hypothetical protein [Shimia thalassica]MDP2519219.1 hypothetical protein [Shimia thalassica]